LRNIPLMAFCSAVDAVCGTFRATSNQRLVAEARA
jgi:hypothetical protein